MQGDLIKFAANAFSNRYLVLTKSELKWYKSKETFLTVQPPLGKASMIYILTVDKFDVKHPKKVKNGVFFKIDLINPDDFKNQGKANELSIANSPNKSKFIVD